MSSTDLRGAHLPPLSAPRAFVNILLYDMNSTCVEVGPWGMPEGLPLACEVIDGNRMDVTTVEVIVEVMRKMDWPTMLLRRSVFLGNEWLILP